MTAISRPTRIGVMPAMRTGFGDATPIDISAITSQIVKGATDLYAAQTAIQSADAAARLAKAQNQAAINIAKAGGQNATQVAAAGLPSASLLLVGGMALAALFILKR